LKSERWRVGIAGDDVAIVGDNVAIAGDGRVISRSDVGVVGWRVSMVDVV